GPSHGDARDDSKRNRDGEAVLLGAVPAFCRGSSRAPDQIPTSNPQRTQSRKPSAKVLPMPFSYEEFDLSGVRTYPLASRRSKARAEDFAKPSEPGGSFKAWFDKLPGILAGDDVRHVVRAIVDARARQAGIIWGI